MGRYIDLDKCGQYRTNHGGYPDTFAFPPWAEFEDVAPVIHAHWVHRTAEWNFTEECSKCHFGHDYRTPFCPICGAKMDEEVE